MSSVLRRLTAILAGFAFLAAGLLAVVADGRAAVGAGGHLVEVCTGHGIIQVALPGDTGKVPSPQGPHDCCAGHHLAAVIVPPSYIFTSVSEIEIRPATIGRAFQVRAAPRSTSSRAPPSEILV